MRRSIKKSTKQKIFASVLAISVLVISFICSSVIIIGNLKDQYQTDLNIVKGKLDENKRVIYEVTQDITAGEILSEENCEEKTVYNSQDYTLFATSNDLGKKALVNLPVGSHVMHNMIMQDEFSESDREIEYEAVKLSVNLSIGDYVDIRLCYPNGEDYTVLSKKQLKQIDQDNVICYLWNNEEEIQFMSSAIVDAYLYEGAYLYTTKYVNPEIQEASVVTYIPSLATIDLITKNPNVVSVASKYLNKILRKELENRLANSLATSVSEIDWKIETNATSVQNSVTDNKTDEFTTYNEEVKAKKEDEELGPDDFVGGEEN